MFSPAAIERAVLVAADNVGYPGVHDNFEQATPAAPTPLTTTLISLISLPTIFSAFINAASTTTAVPCWSSVKDRDVELFLEPLFDLKAARRGNVFQVYAAESCRDCLDGAHDLVRVFGVQANRKGVDSAKFFEEHCLPFHHRHGRSRPDVAEAEHGCAVSNYSDGVFLYR